MLNEPTYADGLIDADWDTYNALDAVRSSWLIAMKRSPAACLLAMMGGDKDSKSLRLGRALHSMILEPLEHSVIIKDWDARTKEGKQRASEIPDGATVLMPEEYNAVAQMAESVRTHPMIGKMIGSAKVMEQSMLWTRNGRRCKSRVDLGADDWVADLKSTRSLLRFSPYSMTDYSYHCQAAWYLSAFKFLELPIPQHFYFFVVNSTPPYESAAFRLDAESLAAGIDETNKLFAKFLQCEKDESWPKHEKSLLVARVLPPQPTTNMR